MIDSSLLLNLCLVDPLKESGQSLFRQYAGKKGKVVLDAQWIYKCIEVGQLQSYQNNFAGCKLTGNERYLPHISLIAFVEFHILYIELQLQIFLKQTL